jgi:hypothetical protein
MSFWCFWLVGGFECCHTIRGKGENQGLMGTHVASSLERHTITIIIIIVTVRVYFDDHY